VNEPYPGWFRDFEYQKRLSAERRREQGDEPIPDEIWDKWREEILEELSERKAS